VSLVLGAFLFGLCFGWLCLESLLSLFLGIAFRGGVVGGFSQIVGRLL